MSLSSFSPHKTSSQNPSSKDESSSSLTSSFTSSPLIGQQWFLLESEESSSSRILQSQYKHSSSSPKRQQWLYVLPVLLLEFLAIGLTRAVLPSILLQEYGHRVYIVLGSADCIRGLLAFFACPLFGKLSDLWGRKLCLLITVFGSCAPVCSLALFSWQKITIVDNEEDLSSSSSINLKNATGASSSHQIHYSLPQSAIPMFVLLLSLSGMFSSTFTLVFAYISDTVKHRNERVSAYGLALACFGLSFTIGPMAGGYLAQSHTHYVFTCSLMLTLLDLLYIYFLLPESLEKTMPLSTSIELLFRKQNTTTGESNDYAWSPLQSVLFLLRDPFLRKVGEVALFYYTGVWAVISTLSLYAVQHFHLSPERLGELMSALGLCTMIAEAVLVRVIIPWVGEKKAIQFGLVSFALQCLVLGAATEPWHLFICVGFSLLGNLVYPSLSSLVSGIVDPESNGEALGAINGVKALTEGIGPLIFGALMTISEDSNFPGWPYWIASVFVLIAYQVAKDLPDTRTDDDTNDSDKEFIYELQFKQRRQQIIQNNNCVEFTTPPRDEDEYRLLLSEIEEESSDEEKLHTPYQDDAALTTPANKNRNQTENSEMLSTTDHGFPKPAFIQQQTEHSFVTNTPIIGGPHFAMKPEYPTILFSSTSAEKDDDFQKNKK